MSAFQVLHSHAVLLFTSHHKSSPQRKSDVTGRNVITQYSLGVQLYSMLWGKLSFPPFLLLCTHNFQDHLFASLVLCYFLYRRTDHQHLLDVLNTVRSHSLCHKLNCSPQRGRLVVEEGLFQLYLFKRKALQLIRALHPHPPLLITGADRTAIRNCATRHIICLHLSILLQQYLVPL